MRKDREIVCFASLRSNFFFFSILDLMIEISEKAAVIEIKISP